jgi:hypothetical protein
MITGPDGREHQVRLVLRSGDDPEVFPAAQLRLDGVEVPVDDAPVGYEAPEWKAVQLLVAGGGSEDQWEAVKDRLREASPLSGT